MPNKKTEFIKYINGLRYALLDNLPKQDLSMMARKPKIQEICEKYILPENRPVLFQHEKSKTLMLKQNDPDDSKYGLYVTFDDFMLNIAQHIATTTVMKNMILEKLTNALKDELLESVQIIKEQHDNLLMTNGYFSKKTGIFYEDRKPDFATGQADVMYCKIKDETESVYNILKSLLEENPEYAERMYAALVKEANASRTPTGQFYAAVCDSMPYEPCKGCTANRKTDCINCSRNRNLIDKYRQ